MSVTGVSSAIDLLNDVRTRWDSGVFYLIGPSVSYAVYHEFGTSKMEARPYMRPAAEKVLADPERYARQYTDSPLRSEAQLLGAIALAIEREAKKIVKQKEIWQDGNLHGSIEARRIR